MDPWVGLVADAPAGEPGRKVTLTATADGAIVDQIRALDVHVDLVARWVERDAAMYAILVPDLVYESGGYDPRDDDNISIRAV
ncbi:MAG: hypothetical protein ACRC7O_09155, partial [Fimbriiglobus sp.]